MYNVEYKGETNHGFFLRAYNSLLKQVYSTTVIATLLCHHFKQALAASSQGLVFIQTRVHI